jgi:5-methylcytosine-specific restriction endonuclease McrBC GTP-binding regulatory subunit McrB
MTFGKESFVKWMQEIDGKASTTAVNYANAINKISLHYSRETKKEVDLYKTSDIDLIKTIEKDYSVDGRFSDYGYENHSTNRAAIIKFVKFLEYPQGAQATIKQENIKFESIFDKKNNHDECHALNVIFYGAPGTGKTYHTINKALEVLDKPFLAANAENRIELKRRFDELMAEGKIAFTTFHQSFSYEDFIEGIRANAVDGNVEYKIEDGVFKKIAKAASLQTKSNFDEVYTALCEEIAENGLVLKTLTRSIPVVNENSVKLDYPHPQ